MTKAILTILLFLSCIQQSFASKIDLCQYFGVKMSNRVFEGKNHLGQSFTVKDNLDGALGQFITEHSERFNYIIIKAFKGSDTFSKLFPDTVKINTVFCRQLQDKRQLMQHFEQLTPLHFLNTKIESQRFTEVELMYVASRFFYCNRVTKDTGIGSNICVGINGLRDLQTEKDFTCLEAFAFEAIFQSMHAHESAKFVENFSNSIRKSLALHKQNFETFDALLLEVRNDCFKEMEQDEDLKQKLLAYYYNQKNTFNFIIQ